MDFFASYVVLAEIYVLLALSTNLLVGVVGIFSVSQAAVFGVGAYIVGDFLLTDTLGFLPSVGVAIAACVVLNVLTPHASAPPGATLARSGDCGPPSRFAPTLGTLRLHL